MISRNRIPRASRRSGSTPPAGELVGGVWPRRVWVAGWLAFAAFFVLKAVPGPPLRAAASRPAGVARQECAQPDSHPRAPDGTWTIGGYRVTTKNIEDVTDRDLVLAKDPDTGELAGKAVLQTFRRVSDHLRILRIRNADGTEQTIETTNEHPFWVPDRGWVNAGDLATGDTVTHTDGLSAELLATTFEPHPEGIAVYNFEVADLHNYFVSQSPRAPPVLVHNTCGIALGVREGLEEFAEGVGAQSWRKWGGDDFVYNFMDVMNDSSRKIHFNLTLPGGKQIDHWAAVLEGSGGLSRSRATSWELTQIYQNPQWWDRITWWHNGEKVGNPFLR